jgi:hypothetical protein
MVKHTHKVEEGIDEHPQVRPKATDSRLVPGDGENRLVTRQLLVTLQKGVWYREISERHPDTVFQVINWLNWTKGSTIADVRVHHSDSRELVKEVKEIANVSYVEQVSADSSSQRLSIVFKTPSYVPLFKRYGVLQKAPIRISNGRCAWEIVGTDERIQKLIRALRKLSIGVVADPLSRSPEESGLILDSGVRPTVAIPLPIDKTGLGHLTVCRLRMSFQPPYWHTAMAARHPDAIIDVLGFSLMADGMIADIRVHTRDIAAWIDDLRKFKDVRDVRPLGSALNANTARVFYDNNELFAAMCRLHLVLRVPFNIWRGNTEVLIAGPDRCIRRFIEMFPNVNAKVEAVFNTEKKIEPILTRRQVEVFRRAWVEGYFEVPRRVSLTELSNRMGVAASSLSEILAVAEKKLRFIRE